MKILIEMGDDYARALTIMARGLNKSSRQELIADVLSKLVDQNTGLLEQSRAIIAAEKGLGFNDKVQIDLPKEPPIPMKRYRFLQKGGEVIEGDGVDPMSALRALLGREITYAEYKEEFDGHESVKV